MKFNILSSFFIIFVVSISVHTASAQSGSPSVAPARPSNSVNYRILANYNYIMTSPSDLNDHRSQFLWNGTTASQGTFSNMNGFSVGIGYLVGRGFLGLEYAHGTQDLASTLISPSTTTVKDSLDYDTVYLVYDWLLNQGPKQSYELGVGVGQAIKFQYHNVLSAGGTTEDLIWQATPIVFKVTAHYNFHFSHNVKFRVGAAYESATSSTMKADTNHPTITVNGSPVISGQNLKYANGADVKVDISGPRLSAGLVVAF